MSDEEVQVKPKATRTDKQKEATQKALAKIKEKREKLNELATKDAQQERKKKSEETEERLLGKLMDRLGVDKQEDELRPAVKKPKKQQIIVEQSESESESEPEIVIVKKTKPKKKKQVIIQEESSEEEEKPIKKMSLRVGNSQQPLVKAKASANAKPKPEPEPEPEPVRRTTGNKMLDKLYGYS
jgi:hypothetical protein